MTLPNEPSEAMIEAGAKVLLDHDEWCGNEEDFADYAKRIYLAMQSAAPAPIVVMGDEPDEDVLAAAVRLGRHWPGDVVTPFEDENERGKEYCRRIARTVLAALSTPRDALDGWQPIETAPVDEEVDWWIAGLSEDGWRKTGYRCNSADPLAIVVEDGSLYWPHENGGYATHWRQLPDPPPSPIR